MTAQLQIKPIQRAQLLELLRSAGMDELFELLLFAPTRYVDFTDHYGASNAFPVDGSRIVIPVELTAKIRKVTDDEITPFDDKRIKRPSFVLGFKSQGREIFAYFHPRVKKDFFVDLTVGEKIFMAGVFDIARVSEGKYAMYVLNPDFCPEEALGSVCGIYDHLMKVNGTRREKAIRRDSVTVEVRELIKDEAILQQAVTYINDQLGQFSLPEKYIAGLLKTLHLPECVEQIKACQDICDELGIRKFMWDHQEKRTKNPASKIDIKRDVVLKAIKRMPFKLSESQQAGTLDMLNQIASDYPARTVLNGELGSGKSWPLMIIAAVVHWSGKFAAIVVPKVELAKQMAKDFQTYFPEIPVVFMAGAKKPKSIDMSKNPVLIGTTGIANWCYKQDHFPDWVAVDESQLVGRDVKDTLAAPHTNVCDCTGTPIPMSLSRIIYGTWQIVRLFPHVEKDIVTKVIEEGDAVGDMLMHIKQIVNQGYKCAVVFARVYEGEEVFDLPEEEGGDEKIAYHSLEEHYPMWEKNFPGKVVKLFGSMSEKDRDESVGKIKSGEASILLSTTVLSEGFNIPKLAGMIIHNAETFGMSQLHQTRGRLVRAAETTGYCYLHVRRDAPQKSITRLKFLETCNDGFQIAQSDLDNRGPGDLLSDGKRQSGKGEGGLIRNRDISPDAMQPFLESLKLHGDFSAAIDRELPDFDKIAQLSPSLQGAKRRKGNA